jgi:hypothetical protein
MSKADDSHTSIEQPDYNLAVDMSIREIKASPQVLIKP